MKKLLGTHKSLNRRVCNTCGYKTSWDQMGRSVMRDHLSARHPVPAFLPARVTVTAAHIARGEPGVYGSCPIALALSEAINSPAWRARVSVFCDTVAVFGDDVWPAALPPEALDFIGRFDNGETVAPFSFDLTWREGDES